MNYIDGTERIGDLIVQVFDDEMAYAMNPREDTEPVTEIYGEHRSYEIGDGKPPLEHMRILERGGIVLLYRYMRRFGDPNNDNSPVLGFRKLNMLDHSGVTYYIGEIGTRSSHWTDPGGWDSGTVGYVFISRKRWDERAGGDPFAVVDGEEAFPLGKVPVKEQGWLHLLKAEVQEYDDWAKGNVWAFRIVKPCDHADEHDTDESIADCPHSETVGAVGGYIGDPKYAWEEARSEAKAIVPAR